MMRSFAFFAAIAATVTAMPSLQHARHAALHKRDLVWVTVTDLDIVTVDITKTVYGPDSTPTPSQTVAPAQKNQIEQDGPHSYSAPAPPVAAAPNTPEVAKAAAPTSPTTMAVVAAAPTTSAAAVAPVVKPLSTYVAPAPASTYVAPAPSHAASSSSAAAAPASYGPSNCAATSAGSTCTDGYFSYYDVGMGACGVSNTDSEYVFAISESIFDANMKDGNPNNNPLCKRQISITTYAGSKITAQMMDRCVGCDASGSHLDLSPSLWDAVSKGDPKADGLCHGYSWEWL